MKSTSPDRGRPYGRRTDHHNPDRPGGHRRLWRLPGIFRDVTLLHRPEGSAGDFFVHASYDHTAGDGTLRVDSTSVPALAPASPST